MILNNDNALKVAEFLLQVKAIKLNVATPFTWASGIKSPIYCDNRISLSYPSVRTYIRQKYVETILETFGKPDMIAGVATGGIAQGALIAQDLGIPFVYVRSSMKEHGMGNQIEGYFEKEQSVVVIEDLISTGGSSLKAVEVLREASCQIKGLVAIFTYDLALADENFKNANCPYYTLTNYEILLEQALKLNYINKMDMKKLKQWNEEFAKK